MVSYRAVRLVIACTLALAATWTGCLSLASPSPAPPEATRTVDVHVRRLRAKTEAGGELLETVRGVGYRLVPPPEDDE